MSRRLPVSQVDGVSEFIPERLLLYGIIRQAAYDAYSSSNTSPTNRRSAVRWFKSQNTFPFSFIWICSIIDREPSKIHQGYKDLAQGKLGTVRAIVYQ